MKLTNTNTHTQTLHSHNIPPTITHNTADRKQLTHRRIVSWRISRQQEQTTHQTRPQYQRKNCSRVGRPSLPYYQWQLHTSNHYFSKHLPSPRKLWECRHVMCVYLMTMIMVLHSSFSSCLFHTLIHILSQWDCTYLINILVKDENLLLL